MAHQKYKARDFTMYSNLCGCSLNCCTSRNVPRSFFVLAFFSSKLSKNKRDCGKWSLLHLCAAQQIASIAIFSNCEMVFLYCFIWFFLLCAEMSLLCASRDSIVCVASDALDTTTQTKTESTFESASVRLHNVCWLRKMITVSKSQNLCERMLAQLELQRDDWASI